MTINASDEWKEHALHPEKSDTGENAEMMTPAGERTSDPAGTLSSEVTAAGAPGSLPAGTGPNDAPAAELREESPRTNTIQGA